MPTSSPRVSRGFRKFAVIAVFVLSGVPIACISSPQAKEAKYLSRGKALLKNKDYSRALLEFKNASSAMPRDAEPFYQTGMAYLESGNFLNGIAALRKATELNPGHQQAQLKLAELMTTSGNKDVLAQASSRLEAVLSASPDNAEAHEALALTEWKLGKTEEATDRLEETLRKLPSRLQSSVELAKFKLGQKDLDGAEQVLRKAIANSPQSPAAELALGQLYMLTNEPAKAEVELRKALQLDSKNAAALMGLAAIQVAGQRMEDAERTYRQLAALPDANFRPVHAMFLFKIGRRDAALSEFEALLKQTPNDREARNRLVAAYQAMGKTQAAQNLVDAALKSNPKDGDALSQKAGLFMLSGKTADAEGAIKEALHLKPDFAPGHALLARIYKKQNLKMSERQELNEALRLNPALLQARVALARNFTLANQPKSALDLLSNTPANQKLSLAVMVERNWALLAAGETKDMRSALDQGLRVKRLPDLLIQDAILRMQQADYAGARAAAEEALQANPEDLRGARLVADTYVAQKQPIKAEERLTSLVAAHQQSAALANLLGQWYLNANNLSAARKAFEASASADPRFVSALLGLAQVDYREKRLDASRQRLLTILTIDPKHTATMLMLGTLAGENGDREEAITRYRAVVAADSTNVMALNNLAYTLATTEPDEALKYAQQAVELAPGSAAVEDTLGWVYYRKAIYGIASTYLETAVAKEPTARRQFHLAMSYLKSGKRDLGEKILQLALRQDPTLPQTEKGW